MNRATQKMQDLAERLIVYESEHLKSCAAITADFSATEKLRPFLETFMGNAGFRALLMRALALAGEEVPWLREVQVNSTGSLEVPHELSEKMAAKAVREGGVMLLAQLLGLMVAFIGEKLTLQLMRDVWPTLKLNDLNTRKEDPS
jgi:hypothetical protein